MTYLLLILGSIILFALFLGLTVVEGRTGTRVFGTSRAKLDKKVARISFVIQHVHWSNLLGHALQSFFERIIHDAAHWSLIFVRFIERELTNTVRYLRDRRPNLLAPKPSRSPILTQAANYVRKTFHISRTKKSETEK